ncbi:STAS domain-containing protein [Nocardia sp. NPDC050435]|uniref:STAS domain-containing protein n=1 Tax=Nocardia sp. NPDC050435 TaxID=3155040 RepID=UPI0033F7CFF3
MLDISRMLSIETDDRDPEGPVLVVSGEIDIHSVTRLSEALEAALGGHPVRVVVDLEAVSFLGSAAVAALARANTAAWPHTTFSVVAAGAAARPLRLTARETGLTLYPRRAMALAQTPL